MVLLIICFQWLVNHIIQLAAADGFGDVLRNMVPDSKIAQSYKCARTKSTHIALTLASDTAFRTVLTNPTKLNSMTSP